MTPQTQMNYRQPDPIPGGSMTSQRPSELISAFLAIIFITLVYLSMNVVLGETPAASSFYGHGMGVLGFVLMLMTETLYSLRKRSRLARWGQMSSWLKFHIFTGIVGPYLVLLHSSWKFNGVAGVLTLMTGMIVLSGFIGRYLYTSIPRTADGLVMEAEELERQILQLDAHLKAWAASRPMMENAALAAALPQAAGSAVLEAGGGSGLEPLPGGVPASGLAPLPEQEPDDAQVTAMQRRRETLRRQAGSLQAARKLLATWHAVHIPIGLALFTLALVHILAAIYFAELM